MTRVILDIRDDRGRFVTRLHPDDATFALWQAAAAVKGVSIAEFVRVALREYLDQFDPAPKEPPTCPGCKHVLPDPHEEVYPGTAWCVNDMNAVRAVGEDPRSVGPCY